MKRVIVAFSIAFILIVMCTQTMRFVNKTMFVGGVPDRDDPHDVILTYVDNENNWEVQLYEKNVGQEKR